MQGVRDIGRHDEHLSLCDCLRLSTEGYFGIAVQDIYHGVKRCGVFTQALILIKGKEGDTAAILIYAGFYSPLHLQRRRQTVPN
jgi:hypothetical protein